jgi:hypothetical protein
MKNVKMRQAGFCGPRWRAVLAGILLTLAGPVNLLALAPADQNFDSIQAGTLSSLNGSLTFSGVIYSTDTVNDQMAVDTINNITGGLTSLGTGNGLSAVWDGSNTGTYLQFASVSNTNNFKIVSYNAEVFGHLAQCSEIYTLSGYRNGVQVASATVNFHVTGSYGTGTNIIGYNRLTTTQEEEATGDPTGHGANCGTLSFAGSAWNNVDQVRMTVADSPPNTILVVAMDNVVFAAPVLPNLPPTNVTLSASSLNESAGVNGTVGTLSTTDPDSSSFTYSLVSGTGSTDNGSFNISGSTLRANNASLLTAGAHSVRIQTDDGSGGTFAKVFSITVVDDIAPAAPTQFAANASGSSVGLSWINPTASDFASTTIRRSTTTFPANISAGTLVAQGLTGTTHTDNALADGTYYYSIFALDGSGNVSVAATATVTVDTTPPTVAISAPSTTLTRSGPVTFTVTWSDANLNAASISLLANQVTLNTSGTVAVGSITVSGSGATRTVQLSSLSGDGTVGISLPANTAADQAGNNAGAAGPSTTATVDNTAPTVAISSPSVATTASGPVTFTITYTGANSVTLSAGDITLVGTGSATGTVGISGSGNTTRTVTISGISGSGTLAISLGAGTASDTAGNEASATGASATVAVNTPPTVAADTGIITVGEGAAATNTGTFADVDGNATVTLSASVGTVSQNNTAGTWSWGYATTGTADSRTVTITANDGVNSPVITTFALTVTNVAPTAIAQSIITPENVASNILLTASAPGTNTITIWNITAGPTNGTLSGTAPALTYTPNVNFSGNDSFRFTVTDGEGVASAEATIAITVTAVNQPPVPGADSIARPNNTRVAKVTKSVLLANDTDPEGDPLSITGVGNATPAGATVAVVGTFVVYTAPATNAGDGSFTYTLSDGPGGHAVAATVTVVQTSSTPTGAGPNSAQIAPSGNDYIISFIGVPGRMYRVQYTTSLSAPYTWTEFSPLAIFTAPTNGVFGYTDTNPPGPVRLYRAVPHP